MSGSWEESSAKKKTAPIIIAVCLLFIVGLLIYNNVDIFFSKTSAESKEVAEPEPEEKQPVNVEQSSAAEKSLKKQSKPTSSNQSEPKKSATPTKKSVPKKSIHQDTPLVWVELPNIKCMLADKDNFYIVLAVKLYFKGEELRKEIYFNREDIKIRIQQLLRSKKHEQVVVKTLKEEIQSEINSILTKGQLSKIEVTQFHPVAQ